MKNHKDSDFVGISGQRRCDRRNRNSKIFEQNHDETKNIFVADHWTRVLLQNYQDTTLSDDSLINITSYRKPRPRKATSFRKAKETLAAPLKPKYYPVINRIVDESPYLTVKDHKNIDKISKSNNDANVTINKTYKHIMSFQADYKSKPGQYKMDDIDVELSRNIPKETMNKRRQQPYFAEIDSPILESTNYHIGTNKMIFSDNFKVELVPHCLTAHRGKVQNLKNTVEKSRASQETLDKSENEIAGDLSLLDAFAVPHPELNSENEFNENEIDWYKLTETMNIKKESDDKVNGNDPTSGVAVTSGDVVNCLVNMMTKDFMERQQVQDKKFQNCLATNQLHAEETLRQTFLPIGDPKLIATLSSSSELPCQSSSSKKKFSVRPLSAGKFGGISSACLHSEPVLVTRVRPQSAVEISRRISNFVNSSSTSLSGEYLVSLKKTKQRLVLDTKLPIDRWSDVLKDM